MQQTRRLRTAEIHAIRLGCASLHRAGNAPYPFDFFEQTFAVVERRLNCVYQGEDLNDPECCLKLVVRAARLFMIGEARDASF